MWSRKKIKGFKNIDLIAEKFLWDLTERVLPTMIWAAGIIHKIPKPRAGKIRHKGTSANNNTEHCAHTLEGIDVRVQKLDDEK
jgi:hypothetical protein